MKKKVLVLFGGNSPEHEVSCSSAASVIENLDNEKFEIYVIGITKENEWLLTEATPNEIKDGKAWECHSSNKAAVISPSENDGIIVFDGDKAMKYPIDIVFPVLHGENGEDGSVQGLCELANLKYVGSNICSSACSMDKAVTKYFVDQVNIKQPKCYFVNSIQYKNNKEKYVNEAENFHNGVYPVIVKPSKTGSSIGVSIVNNREELADKMDIAGQFEGSIMVEQFIKGRELKVAVLGNSELMVGSICEVKVENDLFNDYELKYKKGGSHKQIPALIDKNVEEELVQVSKEIYMSMGCSGFARIDYFLTDDNEVYFNEINTIPGLTTGSIYSLMMEDIGVSYGEMLEKLIELGLKGE